MILTLHNNYKFDYLLQTVTSKQNEFQMSSLSHIVAIWIFFAEKIYTMIFELLLWKMHVKQIKLPKTAKFYDHYTQAREH